MLQQKMASPFYFLGLMTPVEELYPRALLRQNAILGKVERATR